MDLVSETKGFLPKVYEIFWNELPLDCLFSPSRPLLSNPHKKRFRINISEYIGLVNNGIRPQLELMTVAHATWLLTQVNEIIEQLVFHMGFCRLAERWQSQYVVCSGKILHL